MTQNQHDGACVREESLTVAPTTLIDQHRDGNRLEGGVRQEVSAMHRSPVVSVVIVVYRDRGEVEALLENLKTFRRSEVEVVIIDGGSDDGTLEVLRKNSDCIDYWLSEPDEGIYDAMNKGIAAAQGEYVIHLNAGDRLLCVPFAALKACSTRNVDVLCCGVLDEGCKSFMPRRSVLSKIRNGWHHQGTFYRRTGFLGYDKSYRVYGDFDHNLKTAWFDIEKRVLDQAYMIKVTDTGSLRGYNTRVQGLKPYFYIRFWNTWLK